MGFTIYLPSLALNAVTPLQLSWTLILTGGICTFYTAFVSRINKVMYSNKIVFFHFVVQVAKRVLYGGAIRLKKVGLN